VFDYSASAELFPRRAAGGVTTQIGYRRFSSAAEAILFAIEVLPSTLLRGTFLEVDDLRLGAEEIRLLYEHDEFPLRRKPPTA